MFAQLNNRHLVSNEKTKYTRTVPDCYDPVFSQKLLVSKLMICSAMFTYFRIKF